MGETDRTQIRPVLNGSLTIADSDERLTNLASVVCLRELDEKLGVTHGIANALVDPRDPSRIEHRMSSLLRSWTYTMAAQSCSQLSASRLAMDPALKLAASDSKGTSPLGTSGTLASQPTLSRFLRTLGKGPNLTILSEGLFQSAARGIRAGTVHQNLQSVSDPIAENKEVSMYGVLVQFVEDCIRQLGLALKTNSAAVNQTFTST